MMGNLSKIKGDATRPVGEGNKLICHICNDRGAWGAGFVVALSRRWREPEENYRDWHNGKNNIPFVLGEVQVVKVEDGIWVANMLAQHGTRLKDGIPPIRYDALESCLEKAADHARDVGASLHMPKIGAGLAGGDWQKIKVIITKVVEAAGVDTTIYEFV
jgi:O-acetyl-ADP-ribose deacetylase (regulator of RNase III)